MNPEASTLRSRTFFVAVALLLMTASFILTKTARDTLYFSAGGLRSLPLAYAGIAMMGAPIALLTLWVMRLLGSRVARIVSPTLVAFALAGSTFVVEPGAGLSMTLFFMAVPLVFGVLFSMSWLLAAELLRKMPASKLASSYGTIGAASIAGGIVGGTIARAASMSVPPQALFLLAGIVLLVSVAMMGWAQLRFPAEEIIISEEDIANQKDMAKFGALLRTPYARYLLIAAMASAVAGVLIEFQFYFAATVSKKANARFFADLYIFLSLSAFVVQLLVMPKLQKTIGVYRSLLILPLVLVGGVIGLLVHLSVFTGSALRVAEGGLKSSIHRANWEQAYLPLPGASRGSAKLLVDGMGARAGEGVAALFLFGWIRFIAGEDWMSASATSLMVVLLVMLVVWAAAVSRLKAHIRPACSDPKVFRADLPLPDSCVTVATLGPVADPGGAKV